MNRSGIRRSLFGVVTCGLHAVIAAEDGDGPNVTANLGVEVVVEVCGLTRVTEDEDELV